MKPIRILLTAWLTLITISYVSCRKAADRNWVRCTIGNQSYQVVSSSGRFQLDTTGRRLVLQAQSANGNLVIDLSHNLPPGIAPITAPNIQFQFELRNGGTLYQSSQFIKLNTSLEKDYAEGRMEGLTTNANNQQLPFTCEFRVFYK